VGHRQRQLTDSEGARYASVIKEAFDKPVDGDGDAFKSRLSDNGSKLDGSTVLGGTGLDIIQVHAVPDNGSAYIAGATDSPRPRHHRRNRPALPGRGLRRLHPHHPPHLAHTECQSTTVKTQPCG